MELTTKQQAGIYMVCEHLCQRGAGSLEEMHAIRSMRDRTEPEDTEQVDGGVRVSSPGVMVATFSEEELGILRDGIRVLDEAFQQEGTPVPEWLAAADEAVRSCAGGEP
jgi:hypothetical protein